MYPTVESWTAAYKRIGELESESIPRFAKQASSALLIFLLLSTFGTEDRVSVTIGGVTASISAAFVTLYGSIALFFTAMALQHHAIIVATKSRLGTRMSLHGFSINAYATIEKIDAISMAVPLSTNLFFDQKLPISRLLILLTSACLTLLLVPLVSFGYYLFNLQIDIAASPSIAAIYRISAGAGVFTILATFLYLLLFNLPIPTTKNIRHVRWGFLYRASLMFPHPHINKWLRDAESDRFFEKKPKR